MSKKPSNPNTAESIESLGDFYFQVTSPVEEGSTAVAELPSETAQELQKHGLLDILRKATGLSVEKADPKEVMEDWSKRVAQMRALISKSAKSMPRNLPLESVSFSLTFNAKAGVWFFAEVGGAATVQITFKRKV